MLKRQINRYKNWGRMEVYGQISCSKCDFKSCERGMKLHAKMKHPEAKYSLENICDFCSFTCKTQKEYKDHLRGAHRDRL